MATKKSKNPASTSAVQSAASAATIEAPAAKSAAKTAKSPAKAAPSTKPVSKSKSEPATAAAAVEVLGNGGHRGRAKPDHDAIAKRAWEIWQGEGCPDGREVEHWLRAEEELAG